METTLQRRFQSSAYFFAQISPITSLARQATDQIETILLLIQRVLWVQRSQRSVHYNPMWANHPFATSGELTLALAVLHHNSHFCSLITILSCSLTNTRLLGSGGAGAKQWLLKANMTSYRLTGWFSLFVNSVGFITWNKCTLHSHLIQIQWSCFLNLQNTVYYQKNVALFTLHWFEASTVLQDKWSSSKIQAHHFIYRKKAEQSKHLYCSASTCTSCTTLKVAILPVHAS